MNTPASKQRVGAGDSLAPWLGPSIHERATPGAPGHLEQREASTLRRQEHPALAARTTSRNVVPMSPALVLPLFIGRRRPSHCPHLLAARASRSVSSLTMISRNAAPKRSLEKRERPPPR
jgi:hypothetical protein